MAVTKFDTSDVSAMNELSSLVYTEIVNGSPLPKHVDGVAVMTRIRGVLSELEYEGVEPSQILKHMQDLHAVRHNHREFIFQEYDWTALQNPVEQRVSSRDPYGLNAAAPTTQRPAWF